MNLRGGYRKNMWSEKEIDFGRISRRKVVIEATHCPRFSSTQPAWRPGRYENSGLLKRRELFAHLNNLNGALDRRQQENAREFRVLCRPCRHAAWPSPAYASPLSSSRIGRLCISLIETCLCCAAYHSFKSGLWKVKIAARPVEFF